MRIALDYDGTYTNDSRLWDIFIASAKVLGHEIFCVTMRFPEETITSLDIPIVYTCRQAKKAYLDKLGVEVDVWVDNDPHFIFTNAG